MINNDNWQGSPRRTGAGAGRDGKPYEKKDVKQILRGQRGAGRFQQGQQFDESPKFKPDLSRREENRASYEQKSFANRESGNSGEGRPRFKPNSGGGFNSNSGGGYNKYPRQEGERKPYQRQDGESRPYQPRQEGEYKPFQRREGEFNKPFHRRDGESRPFQRRDGESRPYQRPDGEHRPYQKREGDYRSYPRPEGEFGSRPRLTVRKQGESSEGFIETRFDNSTDSTRRPRIKRTADYNPNAKYSNKKQAEYRRNEVDLSKPVRLNKFLANAGICSRREADEFIKAGVITVNGEFVTEMGVKVMHSDKVMFHNQLVRSERKVYILLNKPKDTVTTAEDTHDRRTVMDLVKNACSERIYPVGRLDRNTTGVLLLTNDGDLASKLTHPKYDKKKIYHVVLDKPLEIPDFESILEGVMLEDEKIPADALEFIKDDDFKQVGIEIHSGQNRVVRRIFEKLGYKVVRLDRVYFAGLTKKNIPRGKYRFLSEREVNMLKMGAYE
jgi:23S rRNA pseudouridine2605 synthase